MAHSLVQHVPLTIPGPPPSRRKRSMDDSTKKDSLQHYVTFVYYTRVTQSCRGVTVTWCKNPTEHSLSITVDNTPEAANNFTCKIDLESKQAWGKKGLKSFEIAGARVDIFWDFRHAEFGSGPQPCSGYYVAFVYRKEVLLLLGDLDKDAFERTKSQPSTEETILLCKRENVCGKKMFYTRTMLHEVKKEHEIMIETSLSGPDDPEMLITIDGVMVKRVMNLNWKFRGNEIVMVNNMPVHIFWDVHDWLFNEYGSGRGVFIFKPGFPEPSDPYNSNSNSQEKNEIAEESSSSLIGFCHFLYAWRTI